MTTSDEPLERSPVEAFLSHTDQAADDATIQHEHYVHSLDEGDPALVVPPLSARSTRARVAHAFRHFLYEKKPSQYSSIAPRQSDGTRTKPFFFNGGGRGR